MREAAAPGTASFAAARDLCVAEFGDTWSICSLSDFVSEVNNLRKRGMPDSTWIVPARSDNLNPNGSLFADNEPGWQGQGASSLYSAIYTAGKAPCVYTGRGRASNSYHTIAPHWG